MVICNIDMLANSQHSIFHIAKSLSQHGHTMSKELESKVPKVVVLQLESDSRTGLFIRGSMALSL